MASRRDAANPPRSGFQERLLVRLVSHFLARFFMGGLTAEHSDLRPGMGLMLALLSLPGALVSLLLMLKYSSLLRWLEGLPPVNYSTFSIPDKYMFVAYTMTITGLVAVAMWDQLFPDRLDHANLAPLPVSMGQMFRAKLVALGLFFTVFVITLNLGSGALFPLQAEGNQMGLGPWARMVLAHMTANAAAGLFAFFVIFALVGVLTLLAPSRGFRPISFAFQLVLTIALVLLLFATPAVQSLLPQVVNGAHPALGRLPTLWFLGLYQEMLGGAPPAIQALAVRAVSAFSAAGGASLVLYLASYRRCIRRIREATESATREPGKLRTLAVRVFDRCVLRQPFDRGCFHFAASTLLRSQRHYLLMAGFAGLGAAVALQDAASAAPVLAHAAASPPSATLLAAPLSLLFFLLTGLRFLFDLPAELPGNWTFQMAVRARAGAARRVARKLMLGWVVPVAAACLIVDSSIWGAWTGVGEACFVILASLLLAEILLFDYAKIPFTSAYSGPKHNGGAILAVYSFAFFLFSSGLAGLERRTLAAASPLPLVALLATLAAAWVGVSHVARARDRSGDAIVFADEPEPAVLSMGLR